jgi:hypothetical protein
VDLLLVVLFLFYVAALSFFYDSSRLLLAFAGVFCIAAATGWQELALACRAAGRQRIARLGLAAIYCALVAQTAYRPQQLGLSLKPSSEQRAGTWIREFLGAGRRIMDPDGNVAFYADGVADFLPVASLEDTLYFAARRGIQVFAAAPADLVDSRPQLAQELLDSGFGPGLALPERPGGWPADLEHLHTIPPDDPKKPDRAIEIFRVVPR